MPKFTVHSFILLALITGLLVIQGFAPKHHVFYVAPNGNDVHQGSKGYPWATIERAADVLKAGDTVYLRAGTYALTQQVRAKHSGTAKAPITYSAFPGERVVLDASEVRVAPPSGQPPYPHDEGAFQVEGVNYIQVKDLEVINSHNSGITVRNSNHIRLYHNQTENTFSPGIGVWGGTDHKVMGNTVINANDPALADFPNDWTETAHEALSIGGAEQFEVAYNEVKDGKKEGIDVKENSQHGIVHHNYVHHMARQALYVDSWKGLLEDIEVADNVAHDCQGAGFALSVEGDGSIAQNVRVHHNLLYNNWGTGILFGRWGNDGFRQDIKIYQNTVHHNGHGQPNPGEEFYWITGGLYLFSDQLESVDIRGNIFSDNRGFQIGYSDRYLEPPTQSVTSSTPAIAPVLRQKQIEIDRNLISGPNDPSQPIYAGWPPDSYSDIYGINGTDAVLDAPRFIDPESGNFYLADSPTGDGGNPTVIGAFPVGDSPDLWWQEDFPPPVLD